MTGRENDEPVVAKLLVEAAAKAAGLAFQHLFWVWPKKGFTWLGNRLIAQPRISLYGLLPLVAVLVIRCYIHSGLVGEIVRIAWQNEEVSRVNLQRAEKFLKEHKNEIPERPFEWMKGHGEADFQARKLRRETWEDDEARAEEQKKKSVAYIPSVLSPIGPRQPFPAAPYWEIYYHLNHFLFRSWYSRLLVFYMMVGLVLAWQKSPRRRRLKWRAAKKDSSPQSLLLGLDSAFHPYSLKQAERNHHLLIAGTTGSGKTEALGLLARHDISSGRGLVFFDMKGDRQQAHSMLEACIRAGRKDDFLFFTTDEDTACHTYNGTASGKPAILVDRLMMAGAWSAEPYYSEMARAVLSRLIPALASRGHIVTLEDIRTALGSPAAYKLASEWAVPKEKSKFDADLENWAKFYEHTSGLRHNLDNFCQLGERMCTAHADLDFREVFERNRVVYIELNSQMRGVLASSVARLMLEDLKQISGQRASQPGQRRAFSLYIDEARHAVYEGFVGLITQCRSAGIGVVLATQSPLDFKTGPEDDVMRAIVQNTNTKLFFRQVDHDSAEFCANLAGTVDTVSRTTQLVDEGLLGPEESGVYSEREVKEYIAHPDRLKRLSTGRALLIKGTSECAIIDVDYAPIEPESAFAPTLPRAWHAPDRLWLGHSKPPLALTALAEAQKDDQRGAPAKRTLAASPQDDQNGEPAKRKKKKPKNGPTSKEQNDGRNAELRGDEESGGRAGSREVEAKLRVHPAGDAKPD